MNSMRNFFGGNTGGMGPFGNITALFQKLSQFMTNPLGALLGINLNIPQNLNGNYEGMVNHLRNSGQMSNEQFEQIKPVAMMLQNLLGKKF